jgi:hypothetical protein
MAAIRRVGAESDREMQRHSGVRTLRTARGLLDARPGSPTKRGRLHADAQRVRSHVSPRVAHTQRRASDGTAAARQLVNNRLTAEVGRDSLWIDVFQLAGG